MTLEEYINHKAEENRKKWIEEGIGQGIEIGETRARRDAVIRFITYVKEVHPEYMEEDVVHEVSRMHSECTLEEISSYYQEYLSQQNR